MGQLLRVTFENKDHTFKILAMPPAGTQAQEISILLSGEPEILIRNDNGWVFKDNTNEELNRLADALGRAISSRFRI